MKQFSEVRAAIGGIKGVMQKLGDGPPDGHWNPMTKCPFCGAHKTAGVFNKTGVDYFKCHQARGSKKQPCCSGNEVLSEVRYIALRLGLSDTKPSGGGASPAYRQLLEMANCWEEPNADEAKRPKEPKKSPPKPAPEKPEEKSAVEPPVRHNPIAAEPPPAASVPAPVNKNDDDELLVVKAIEVIRTENKASVRLFQRYLHIGHGKASAVMDELEKRGAVGPAGENGAREILKLPPCPPNLIKIKIDDDYSFEFVEAKKTEPTEAVTHKAAPVATEAKDEKSKLPAGMEVLRWFFTQLPPTENEMRAYLEDGKPVPDLIPKDVAYRLKFKPVSLFEKRRLTSLSCERLGLRANPTTNESFLQEALQLFPWDDVRASGLWLDTNRKLKLGRRPNAQFHGKGQIGKKPDKERKNKDDKWVWGFCQPVLIPYFDEVGDLIKLRPHKGGAPGGTVAGSSRIYVPRDFKNCGDRVEKFHEVVICEGEYKAAAIWQTLGLGALIQTDAAGALLVTDPTKFVPVGVCALPGISYVNNPEMRADLERWLVDVGARFVTVAFDDEDKSDKPLRSRFDAQIAARYLATELSKILHVETRVCVLPTEWRNSKGKADWDGALAKITSTTTTKK